MKKYFKGKYCTATYFMNNNNNKKSYTFILNFILYKEKCK